MRKLFFILMFSLSLSVSSEESISRWMADYFKRIHDHIGNENYDKAEKELEIILEVGELMKLLCYINYMVNSMPYKANIQMQYRGLKKH